MKTLFLLALLSASQTGSQQLQSDFEAANERALKSEHKAAIGLYQALLDRGVQNADLYFNLGNAQAQAGDSLQAIISYERALALSPNDEDVRANLRSVREELVGKAKTQSPQEQSEDSVAAADILAPLVNPVPRTGATWALVIINALFFGLLLMFRRAGGLGARRALGAGCIVALLGLIGLGLVVLGHAVVASDTVAVVRQNAEFKEGPHPKFKSKGQLVTGARVRVLKEDGIWLEVQKTDGRTGWIQSKQLVRVEP